MGTTELRLRVAAELRRVFAEIKADGHTVVGRVSSEVEGGVEFHLVDGVLTHLTNGRTRWTHDQLISLASVSETHRWRARRMRGLLERHWGASGFHDQRLSRTSPPSIGITAPVT